MRVHEKNAMGVFRPYSGKPTGPKKEEKIGLK